MAPLFGDQVAPSTQALALGGPAPSKPRVGSRMWYNLPRLGMGWWDDGMGQVS